MTLCVCTRFVCNTGREPSSPRASRYRLSRVLENCIFWAGWASPKSSPGSYGATVALRYLDIYISVQLTWNSRATCSILTPVKFWRGVKGRSCLGSWSLQDLVGVVFQWCCWRHIPKCVSGADISTKLGLCGLDLGSKPTWLQQTPSGSRALGRRSDSTTKSIKRTGYAK